MKKEGEKGLRSRKRGDELADVVSRGEEKSVRERERRIQHAKKEVE